VCADSLRPAKAAYQPPSFTGAQTELSQLTSWSGLVADSSTPEQLRRLGTMGVLASAASLSHGSLLRATAQPSREVEAALAGALAYDKCRLGRPSARPAVPRPVQGTGADLSCLLDKMLVNLGTELAAAVNGRLSVELDARLAYDTDALKSKARALAEMYAEMGVLIDKLLFRVPATWEGIQAVSALEQQGMKCHVTHVFSLTQAAAAAHAGCAVVQPSVGRLQAWYAAHPNARAPGARGTREDAGALAVRGDEGKGESAGRSLVAATVAYMKKHGLKSRVMAAVATMDDVRALAGTDFLVAPVSVLESLAAMPTGAGHNDGIVGAQATLKEMSPIQMRAAQACSLEACELAFSGKKSDFDTAMKSGPAQELLQKAVQRAAESAAQAEAYMEKMWPPAGGL